MVTLDYAPITTAEIASSTVVQPEWGCVGSWLFSVNTEEGGMGYATGQGTSVAGFLEVTGPHSSKVRPASLATALCPPSPHVHCTD